jgi:hypothetical protein
MTTLVGIPTYDEKIQVGLAGALLGEAHRSDCPHFTIAFKASSLLAFAHNALLCMALNNRSQGITHLLIIHSDVLPEPGFMKILHDEMSATGAGVCSGVLPIKDSNGLTSTALLQDLSLTQQPGPREFRRRRVTMREMDKLPETFDARDLAEFFGEEGSHTGLPQQPALLVNTGLMLIDVRQTWVQSVHFNITDTIWKNDQGLYYADVEPEDWAFSRLAAECGATVIATRKVRARHAGRALFPNHGGWGEWDSDQAGLPGHAAQNGNGKGVNTHETVLQG